MKKDLRLTLRLPENMVSDLETLAMTATLGRSVSEVIRGMISEWLIINQNQVSLAKQRLVDKKSNLDLRKVSAKQWFDPASQS